jgi:hypothetical protein
MAWMDVIFLGGRVLEPPTAIFSPGAHMVDEVILILDLTIYERGEAPSSTTPSGNAKTSPGKVQ